MVIISGQSSNESDAPDMPFLPEYNNNVDNTEDIQFVNPSLIGKFLVISATDIGRHSLAHPEIILHSQTIYPWHVRQCTAYR